MRNHLKKLTDFLQKLHEFKIPYTLGGDVITSIMVSIALPGERWEVNLGVIAARTFWRPGHRANGAPAAGLDL
jgi:hypothetical protein